MKTINPKTQSVISLLNTDNTLAVNRLLAHAIGLEETIMYQALIKKYIYYRDKEMLIDDKWFYSTTMDIEESTTFSKKKQKRLSDKLLSLELIQKKKMGMPSKNYYCVNLNTDRIFYYLEQGEKKSKELKEKRIITMRESNKSYRQTSSEYQEEKVKKTSNNHRSAKVELQEVTKRNFKKCQTGTSRSVERELQEVPNGNFKKCQIGTTRSAKLEPQEVTERNQKHKDNKHKEIKHTLSKHSFNYKDTSLTEKERMNEIRAKEYIEYDYLKTNYSDNIEIIDKIKDIVFEILCCEDKTIMFGNTEYDTDEFKKRVKKLDEDLIIDIIEKIKSSKVRITNPESYLTRMIWEESFQFAVKLANT